MHTNQKRGLKVIVYLFVAISLFSIGAAVINPKKAVAATGEVIDRSTIKVGDQEFFDADMDSTFRYEETTPSDRCADFIDDFDNSTDFRPGQTPPNARLTIRTPAGAGSDACSSRTEEITWGSTRNNFLKAFAWQSESTIYSTDLKLTFSKSDEDPKVFASEKEIQGCRDTLTISSDNKSSTLVVRVGGREQQKIIGSDDYDWFPFARPSNNIGSWKWNGTTECWESPPVTNVLLDGTPESGSKGGAASRAANDSNINNNTCESLAGGAMSWVLCPIIKLMDTATATLDTAIRSQLEMRDPNGTCDITANPNNPDCNLYKSWARIRNIALIILVPIMLVMVMGTALNIGGLDAYTVKRAMPRLLIAVLFISISWYITTFMINLTNIVGQGILGLMTQPFGIADMSLVDFLNADTAVALGNPVTGIVVFGALWFNGTLSLGIIWSFIMVAALGLFIGFITLVIRQILILAMVLLAPLAILAWIFPGNDAPWKLWRLTFTKLLLMFPLIMVLIGAGRIAATIIPSQQGSNGLFTQLLVIIAYVLPYFFIPLTFKFAGSFFANIAGFVNDRSKGFFDKQREHRAKERKELKDFAGQNLRFNPNNRFTSKFNTAASWTAAPLDNLAYKYNRTPGLSGRGSKIKASIDAAAMDQTGKLYQELQNAHSFNDAAGRALSGVHDGFSEETIERLKKAGLYNKVPKTLEEMDTFAGILEKSSQETERFAANPLRTVGGRIASLYRDPEMTKANAAAAGMMLASAHGFASSEDLATMHERLVEGGMNSDLAQNMVSRAQVLGQHSRPDIKSTYGVVYDSNGKATSGVVDKAEREATMYERDADGNIVTETFSDGTVAKVRDKKAYKKWSATKRSRALASTIKQSDWMPAKSGAIKEMYGTIKEIANKTETKEDGSVVLTAEAKAMREQVALGASQFSSSDTGAKVIWKELVDDLDLGPQLAQLEAQQAAMQERTAGTAGAGGDGHDGGADAGGAAE